VSFSDIGDTRGFLAKNVPADLAELLRDLVASDCCTPLAKRGIAPVGTCALHKATEFIGRADPKLRSFGSTLIARQTAAGGIGLAANQLAVSARLFAHALAGAAPQVLVNPLIHRSYGVWNYAEACLSLDIEGSAANIERPRGIVITAETLSGQTILLDADEILSRVIQHELDHLEGIEYVQRIPESLRPAIDRVLISAGVDTDLFPHVPYAASDFREIETQLRG